MRSRSDAAFCLLVTADSPPVRGQVSATRGAAQNAKKAVSARHVPAPTALSSLRGGGLADARPRAYGVTQTEREARSMPPLPSRTTKVNVTGVSVATSRASGASHLVVATGASAGSSASTKA